MIRSGGDRRIQRRREIRKGQAFQPVPGSFQKFLEGELSYDLKGAGVVQEDLSGLIEEGVINCLEVGVGGCVRGLVNVVDRARRVLSVVQDIIGTGT